MSDDTTLKQIKRLCLINCLELQDLKERLNVADAGPAYDWVNALEKRVEVLDGKMRELVKAYPHLLDKE